MEQVNGKMLFIALVILCQVTAGEKVSPPVVQDIPPACSSIDDCPDFFNPTHWERFQAACCSGYSGPKYHCQQKWVEEEGAYRIIDVACVWAKTCAAGTHALLKKWTEGETKYADVDCLPCPYGSYQPNPQDSVSFRYPSCSSTWQQCLEEEGYALVRPGNATHDNLCRCWWEGGFRPSWNNPKCLSLEGFDQDDCQCEPAPPCPDGQALNDEFLCVPQISSSTTTHRPQSDTPTTTEKHDVSGGAVTLTSPTALVFALVSFSIICCI